MRSFVKCLEVGDYQEIKEGVDIVHKAVVALSPRIGGRFALPHPHRWWEYGSAVQALMSVYQDKLAQNGMKILDVGSGWSPLGPALAYTFGLKVWEVEPEFQSRSARAYCNAALRDLKKPELTVLEGGVENLPQEQFDAVFCISVLEHVNPANEVQGWKNLAERVKPNGLFFMTTDIVPDSKGHYTFDEQRAQNYTVDVMEDRVDMLTGMGFTPMGQPDYTFRKSEVYDYTFFRCGMFKTGTA